MRENHSVTAIGRRLPHHPVWVLLLLVIACSVPPPIVPDPADGSTPSDSDAGAPFDAGSHADGGTCGRLPEKHVPSRPVCDSVRPSSITVPTDGGPDAACSEDSDCTNGTNGRCIQAPPSRVVQPGLACSYDQCSTQTDCQGGTVCLCREVTQSNADVCGNGNCSVDSDCACGACSPSMGGCIPIISVVGYYCRTPEDECVNDSDCGQPSAHGPFCSFDTTLGHWRCMAITCAG